MPVKGNNFINKLILLFVFDKMEIPLSETTIEEVCYHENEWISFMDCKLTLLSLLDDQFVYEISTSTPQPFYSITPKGRVCLADFYINIPKSMREQIVAFVKANRVRYRKKQEYLADYYMNKDGTYTVFLKIIELSGPQLELKIIVPTKQIAKNIYKKWPEKAEVLFSAIYETLVD